MEQTSDERREVAERLRDEAGGFRRLEKEWGHEPTIDLGDVTAVFQDVAHFAGLDGTVRTCVLFDRLADLIDPPEITEDTSDGILNAHTTGELVRCRDCKYFAVDQSDHDYRSGWWCHRWNTDMVKPDGFCAWASRKEEGA